MKHYGFTSLCGEYLAHMTVMANNKSEAIEKLYNRFDELIKEGKYKGLPPDRDDIQCYDKEDHYLNLVRNFILG